MQTKINYCNKFKLKTLLAIVLLLALAGIWLVNIDSSTAPGEAAPVKLQSGQDSPIEHQPVQNTAVDHDVLTSETPVAASANNAGR